MPQLVERRANAIALATLFAAPLIVLGGWGALIALARSDFWTGVDLPVEQPVPFSHQHHVGGLGIDCRYCHIGVEQSAFAGMPSTETCMTCHSEGWKDAPVLQPVRDSWATGRPIKWTRVHELPDYVYFDLSRLNFAQLMAASIAHAGATSCTRQPLERIVPYVRQPEELVPGKPLYYASGLTLGGFARGVLIETHEGRPTKIEGNTQHPGSLGASDVFMQAELLELYNPERSPAVMHQ